ncbi:hypothetical protein C8Q80DRAFT_460292 [Daedaleopsis nitida]|nr:hypothetical protein C8Q80DRAFT_460292 [Daedaleopsis nitida]
MKSILSYADVSNGKSKDHYRGTNPLPHHEPYHRLRRGLPLAHPTSRSTSQGAGLARVSPQGWAVRREPQRGARPEARGARRQRQIKNACRTARSRTLSCGETLGFAHLVKTLEAMGEFTAEFAAMRSEATRKEKRVKTLQTSQRMNCSMIDSKCTHHQKLHWHLKQM